MALTEEGLMSVPGLLSRWVRLGSGIKAHYVTAGESGPTVILLHGGIIGSSGIAGWRIMAPYLGSHGFRVYCPDMPGFGLTDDPEGFYDYGAGGHVDFLHDFTTALALDSFHLGGNSMGCFDTVSYLLAHPERVVSFAVIAGNVGDIMPRTTMRAADPKDRPHIPDIEVFDGTEDSMRKMMQGVTTTAAAVPDDLVAMRTAHANRHRQTYVPRMRRYLAPQAGESGANELARLRTKNRLDTMTTPGVYLFPPGDDLIAVEGGRLQEDALPKVQFFYPEGCGHQAQTDRPELINQLFLEFFRDGKVSWETAVEAGISTRRPPNETLVAVPRSTDEDGASDLGAARAAVRS